MKCSNSNWREKYEKATFYMFMYCYDESVFLGYKL